MEFDGIQQRFKAQRLGDKANHSFVEGFRHCQVRKAGDEDHRRLFEMFFANFSEQN